MFPHAFPLCLLRLFAARSTAEFRFNPNLRSPCRSRRFEFTLVLDYNARVGVGRRDGQAMFTQRLRMVLHAPERLIQAVFNRMTDPGESFQVRRVKPEEIRVFRCFDNQRIRELNHGVSFCFNPAAFKIAWHVPVGTSFAPWKSTRISRGWPVFSMHRVTFLIGPDGRIKKIWPEVKPDGHAEEVLAAL